MSSFKKSSAYLRKGSPTPSVVKTRQNQSASVQQSLCLEVPPESTRPGPAPAAASHLWLGMYLPYLPLQALGEGEVPGPRAVFEDQQGIRKVLLANAAAGAAGVGNGLSANAALALAPELLLEERDLAREQQALQALAAWAERFTSLVSIEPPDVLLLELAGSLRLFGGLDELRRTIATALKAQGFSATLAIAPTPLASVWLAKAGSRVCIRSMANLNGALSRLPIYCLGWPASVYEALHGMGISCIGDCLRLPRAGFARRFGSARLLELDRALGRLPDPRQSFRLPKRFTADCELSEEQSDSELILAACRELLQKLERFLLTRQLAVQRIRFSFFHLQVTATHLMLGCMEPDGSVERWFELLRIRFERLVLEAPVIAIQLQGGRGQAFTAETGTLPFHKADRQQQCISMAHLVERLSARIGDELVHGVTTVAEHRPQYAWCCWQPTGGIPQCPATPGLHYEREAPQLFTDFQRTNRLLLRRPLWILPEPRPLASSQGCPVYQGSLSLLDGPERLETGWWDEAGIARDYFVAVNPDGMYLWIFRNRSATGRWYLHGMFG